jgi:uncharacterized protein YndB with AHSA1/START domain
MWKKIGIGVLVVILALVVVIATRPSTYHVERSATIAAPPEVVFAQVSDFHKWEAWSPWGKLDPKMKTTYEGTQGTPGASYAWSGDDKVGEGKMTVTAVKPNERLDIKLEFIKPFASTAANGFTVAPAGKDTKVTWFMEGENTFVGKAFSLFADMDSMIGKDFEKGLADLKKAAEAAAQQPVENTPAAVKQ